MTTPRRTAPDPDAARWGRIGGLRRWAGHEPRWINLESLPPETRRAILDLVRAARADVA